MGRTLGGGRRSEARISRGDGGRSGGEGDNGTLKVAGPKVLPGTALEKRPLVYVRSPAKAGKAGLGGGEILCMALKLGASCEPNRGGGK